MPNDLLFVYGLLRSDMSARLESFIPESSEFVAKATVRGRLFDVAGQYPGLVLSETGSTYPVRGEVYRITKELVWAVLDDFEGVGTDHKQPQLYKRRLVTVQLADGQDLEVQVYAFNRSTSTFEEILSGDWSTIATRMARHKL